MKIKTVAFLAILPLLFAAFMRPAYAVAFEENSDAKALILMEASGKKVLYERNADTALPPASVTKIMTILLVLEAIDDGKIALGDTVTVSDYASGMGGSQVYLKAGEEMSVSDLLKSVVVSSANDAAVALAEHVLGSEAAFVARMNERAKELGMENTVFKNTNGLDDSDEGHLCSARDIALMTCEVLRHPLIFDYSTIWMDTIRNGAFGLTNTNRLIRFYQGANGLKTGSTAKAGFCISATAKRDGMQLVAVVMGSASRDSRNAVAASMLDFGFSNYEIASFDGKTEGEIPLLGGTKATVSGRYEGCEILLEKGKRDDIKAITEYTPSLAAPVEKGQKIGCIRYVLGEEELAACDILAQETVPKISYLHVLTEILRGMLLLS